MLLENAVKHGIDNIREGGKIEVHAELETHPMRIHVSNDLPNNYAEKKVSQASTYLASINV